jgi:hypothetical protein
VLAGAEQFVELTATPVAIRHEQTSASAAPKARHVFSVELARVERLYADRHDDGYQFDVGSVGID